MTSPEEKTDPKNRPGKENGVPSESVQEVTSVPNPKAELEEIERKARVNAAWEQMNKGLSVKIPKSFPPQLSGVKMMPQKASPNWMTALGLAPKKDASSGKDVQQKKPSVLQNGTNEEAKKIAAAALAAVKDAAAAAAGRGKVEITEVREFAGEEIEVKKLIDANSKEAAEKAKAPVGPPSAVDAVKKSSNQYLEKVSFLQRTDLREFERERDARLALQSKRKPDMREEP